MHRIRHVSSLSGVHGGEGAKAFLSTRSLSLNIEAHFVIILSLSPV